MLPKGLRSHSYKIQMKNEINEADQTKHIEFAVALLSRIDDDESYLNRIFLVMRLHIHSCISRHDDLIRRAQQANEDFQYVRDSPKCMVRLMYDRV